MKRQLVGLFIVGMLAASMLGGVIGVVVMATYWRPRPKSYGPVLHHFISSVYRWGGGCTRGWENQHQGLLGHRSDTSILFTHSRMVTMQLKLCTHHRRQLASKEVKVMAVAMHPSDVIGKQREAFPHGRGCLS